MISAKNSGALAEKSTGGLWIPPTVSNSESTPETQLGEVYPNFHRYFIYYGYNGLTWLYYGCTIVVREEVRSHALPSMDWYYSY